MSFPPLPPNTPICTASGLWIGAGPRGRADVHQWGVIVEHDEYRIAEVPTTGDGREVVIDVGAHIGIFTLAWLTKKNARARIACIEVCPENIPLLRKNVEAAGAVVFPGACTYEAGNVRLQNCILPETQATCTSYLELGERTEFRAEVDPTFLDDRPVAKITLEDVFQTLNTEYCHVLKLDCEGSELSILRHTEVLPRVRTVLGEYHVRHKFDEILRTRFGAHSGWKIARFDSFGNDHGVFRLENQQFKGPACR